MTTQAVTTKDEKAIEYVPFGAQEKIKLTISIIQKLICVPTKSGAVCSDKDAVRFMMLCQAQHLNPFAGDAYLVGYDGQHGAQFSLITAHQALLKRAEVCPGFEGMESGIIINRDGIIEDRQGDFHLTDEEVVGGWAKVYRKDRKPMYKRLSIEQRKPRYTTPFWEGHKASEQIVKCAEADALRATFPTMLGGLYNAEETTGPIVPVEAQVVENGNGPKIDPTPAQAAKENELEALVTGEGFTFDDFRAWAKETGNIDRMKNADSFDTVPPEFVKSLLRAKKGLIEQLTKMKEQLI